MKTYLHSLQSEWHKTKKSAAFWLVLVGGLFIPLLMTIVQSVYSYKFSPNVLGKKYWNWLFNNSWESMAILLLPAGIIMATSLIAQIEFKNNTWKQVFATPQPFSTLFLAKKTMVVFLLLLFFFINLVGFLLSGYLPSLWTGGGMPNFPPIKAILHLNLQFFVSSLPLVAVQFFIAMRFKNFLISIGMGIGFIVLSIFAFSWKYGYLIPFSHIGMVFTQLTGKPRYPADTNLMLHSVLWFSGLTLAHYIVYLAQKERS